MTVNILNLSDDEIMKLDPSTLGDSEEVSEDGAAEEVNEDPSSDSADTSTADEGGSQDTYSEDEAGDEGAGASDEAGVDPDTEDARENGSSSNEAAADQAKAKTTVESGPDPSNKPVDIEAEYNKLLAPFTANGREMSVKSVDEAITLMQMGANYNKKMAALKPNLKLMKMLESSGLMSEEKISYLIDLASKNTGAINKLIKESGIDPMDLNAESADEYKPTDRTIDDKEIELDAVLEEIQETPTYQRTLNVVGKEWDAASKQIVAQTPQLLKVINSHVQSGIYDLIKAEVERERTFGRLQGVSDIEAYRQVGDAIQAKGGFDRLSAQGQQTTQTKLVVVPPKPKQVDESKLKEKRRAASTAKPAAAGSRSMKEFNPLALSDEEFSKLVHSDFV